MEAVIKKWGNSYALRIPKSIVKMLGLGEEKRVDLRVEGERIIITPKKELDALLEKIDENNRHEEVDFGSPRGKEVW